MKLAPLPSLTIAALLGLLMGRSSLCEQPTGDAPATEVSSRGQIERWIEQLGDDDFDVREAATRELKDREDAKPFLRKLLASSDAEVRRRAVDILSALDRKLATHELDKALELAKDGRIDEVVDRLVHWQGSEDGRKGWEAVYQIATKAAESADQDPSARNLLESARLPLRSSRHDVLAMQPTEVIFPSVKAAYERNNLIRGETINLGPHSLCKWSIIAGCYAVRLRSHAHFAIIACGGSVEVYALEGSIVICDGDFKADGGLENCVVIASGKVTCATMTGGVFISAREVEFPHGGKDRCVVRTGETHPLNFIKFFNPAEAGVEVSADGDGGRVPDGVRVKGVAKDKPFAAAGLQAGDVITAVGGEKIDASGKADDQFDSFRRPLRKALAADEPFTLTVRRGDKTLELTVRPTD